MTIGALNMLFTAIAGEVNARDKYINARYGQSGLVDAKFGASSGKRATFACQNNQFENIYNCEVKKAGIYHDMKTQALWMLEKEEAQRKERIAMGWMG